MENIYPVTPVLFTMPGSTYAQFDTDLYDKKRNALNFSRLSPPICHPPCRKWSRLKHFANFEPGEKWLAIWSVILVRRIGGIVEHPASSSLWKTMDFETPGKVDKYGGFLFYINQSWFGHPCEKKTCLYIVGLLPHEIPPYTLNFSAIEYCISTSKNKNSTKKEVNRKWRKKTPPGLCSWLLETISLINQKQK